MRKWPVLNKQDEKLLKSVESSFQQYDHLSLMTPDPFQPLLSKVGFDDTKVWFPFCDVMEVLGITPQKLRPVFSPKKTKINLPFPYIFKLFGLKTWFLVHKNLPKTIENYNHLGTAEMNFDTFFKLSDTLGRKIHVYGPDRLGVRIIYQMTIPSALYARCADYCFDRDG